jgi:hypothetical protein
MKAGLPGGNYEDRGDLGRSIRMAQEKIKVDRMFAGPGAVPKVRLDFHGFPARQSKMLGKADASFALVRLVSRILELQHWTKHVQS